MQEVERYVECGAYRTIQVSQDAALQCKCPHIVTHCKQEFSHDATQPFLLLAAPRTNLSFMCVCPSLGCIPFLLGFRLHLSFALLQKFLTFAALMQETGSSLRQDTGISVDHLQLLY